jgi:voltage-gated potassium channel
MARLALHPQVGGTVQVADSRVEEIEVCQDCEGVGKTIEDVRGGSLILALRRNGGQLEPQPAPQTVIEAGDMLVAIGSPDALERLEGMFQPSVAPGSSGGQETSLR